MAITQAQFAADIAEFKSILQYLKGAPEIPFDVTVIDRLAPLAVRSGFVVDTGTFQRKCQDNPISTLLEWLLYAGEVTYALEFP